MDRFAVIILNWNSPTDTIACLESILSSTDSGALPMVVDNGSTDGSVAEILGWCAARGFRVVQGTEEDCTCSGSQTHSGETDLVLLRSPENLGFAKGSNLGLKYTLRHGLREVVFLNNDTVVAPGALDRLVEALRNEPEMFATLPLIRIHGTDRIWNCGGRISRLGFRRYHLTGASLGSTALHPRMVCSFFTGCCFAVRTEQFAGRGGFTERFFFGEEDFELALWMLDHGKRAVCLTDALIDHKVSATSSRISGRSARRVYAHYLNRFIHMRLRLGYWRWAAWLCMYVPYISVLLRRTSDLSWAELPRFLRSLIGDARRHDGVSRELFLGVMGDNRW